MKFNQHNYILFGCKFKLPTPNMEQVPLGRKGKENHTPCLTWFLLLDDSTMLPSVQHLKHLLVILRLVSDLLVMESKFGAFTQTQPEVEVNRLSLLW